MSCIKSTSNVDEYSVIRSQLNHLVFKLYRNVYENIILIRICAIAFTSEFKVFYEKIVQFQLNVRVFGMRNAYSFSANYVL